MGCKSGKPVAVGAPKAAPKVTAPIASPLTPPSPTILEHRTVSLPSLDVQVVKPHNALKEVFAAQESLPQEPDRGVLLLPHSRSEQSGGLELDQIDEGIVEPSHEVSDGKQPMSDTRTSPSSPPVKLTPDRPGAQRRVRTVCCDDCCDDATVSPRAQRKRPKGAEPGPQLEGLIEELFRAHDLKGDGLLDEAELVELNEAVARVHDTKDSGRVQKKYSNLFREKLDPDGQPVPYTTFRRYMLEMLEEIDRNEAAQEMMVEQFVAEARLARTVVTGAPILVDKPKPGACYNACLRFCPASEAATEVRPC